MKKLEHVNAHYLKLADDARLAALVAPRMADSIGRGLDGREAGLLLRSMPELKTRAKNLNELSKSARYVVCDRPIAMDEAAAKLLDPAGRDLLEEARDAFAHVDPWEREALEQAAKSVAEARGVGLGKVAGPVRAALTGMTTSPSVFAIMETLGREESMGRIADALDRE